MLKGYIQILNKLGIIAKLVYKLVINHIGVTVKQSYALYIIKSGKLSYKFAKAGFHATKSEFVDAPLIDELPMAMECEFISYDPESCRLVGRIVNVSADESVLNKRGKVDPMKLRPITFDPMNNAYLVLGEKVGNAFQDGKQMK